MNTYEYALKMEEDSTALYNKLAEKAEENGIISILEMLAREEEKHYEYIKGMKNKDNQADLKETTVLDDSRNIIEDYVKNKQSFDVSSSQFKIYKQAKEIEKKSNEFYLEMKNEAEDDYQKKLFGWLAEEEMKHFWIIDDIITHVTRPENWVEDAEFNEMDQY